MTQDEATAKSSQDQAARAPAPAQPASQSSGSPARQSQTTGPLPLRLRDQILFAVAAGLALIAMIAYCVRISRWGRDPIELDEQPQRLANYKIDLNTATWVEWAQLPGIGPVLARRIVEERETGGPFRDVDDLARVRGIGPKRIEAMRQFIRVDTSPSSQPNRDRGAAINLRTPTGLSG